MSGPPSRHRGQHRPDEHKRRAQVHCQYGVKLLDVNLVHRCLARVESGIVDEDVDVAAFGRLPTEVLNRGGFRQVERTSEHGGSAALRRLGLYPRQSVHVPPADREIPSRRRDGGPESGRSRASLRSVARAGSPKGSSTAPWAVFLYRESLESLPTRET